MTMSEKWIVDVRPITLDGEQICEFCELLPVKYWVEEFAMGLCHKCHGDLRKECYKERDKT